MEVEVEVDVVDVLVDVDVLEVEDVVVVEEDVLVLVDVVVGGCVVVVEVVVVLQLQLSPPNGEVQTSAHLLNVSPAGASLGIVGSVFPLVQIDEVTSFWMNIVTLPLHAGYPTQK